MKKLSLIVSIFALFIISTSTFADESTTPSNNNSNSAKENLKSGDSPVIVNVIASIEVKAGHLAEFTKIFTDNVPNVLAEKGCIEYTPTVDVPTSIGVQETNKPVPKIATINNTFVSFIMFFFCEVNSTNLSQKKTSI